MGLHQTKSFCTVKPSSKQKGSLLKERNIFKPNLQRRIRYPKYIKNSHNEQQKETTMGRKYHFPQDNINTQYRFMKEMNSVTKYQGNAHQNHVVSLYTG